MENGIGDHEKIKDKHVYLKLQTRHKKECKGYSLYQNQDLMPSPLLL